VGFAHDGDGDRLVVCGGNGRILDGDRLMGLLALHAFRSGLAGGDPRKWILVATHQSNLGLDRAIEKEGGKVVRVPVGDRNVLHKIRELNAPLGGENSGHLIFADMNLCGDGLMSALRVCRVLQETGKTLDALAAEIPLFPQAAASLCVAEKIPLAQCPALTAQIEASSAALGRAGRVLVRYSGTEKMLRVLVEAQSSGMVEKHLTALKNAAARDLDLR
jgi:phosphoglucosamine mutase